jgi:hypothetical protein
VYNDYLNEPEEGKFVRLYAPRLYTDADLVQKVVLDVTDGEVRDGHEGAPLAPLQCSSRRAHGRRRGLRLEKWVRATGLLTRDLNQIIVSFKDEADSHVADMTDLWESVLGRKPLELARRKEAYRADPRRCGSCARRAGQDSRATHVITARIQERLPSMPAFSTSYSDKIRPV